MQVGFVIKAVALLLTADVYLYRVPAHSNPTM
jgi:hypothetical protein